MTITRTHKKTDLEKRLKLLEMQLHGKKEKLDVRTLKIDKEAGSSTGAHPYPSSRIQHPTSNTDVAYLRADLTKIFILSTIAIAAEFLLFFGSRYDFLRLI